MSFEVETPILNSHPVVRAFVKNEFLEFAIPYVDNGQDHDYYPDFLIRLADEPRFTLIVEVKGRPDALEQVKAAAARRWWPRSTPRGASGRGGMRSCGIRRKLARRWMLGWPTFRSPLPRPLDPCRHGVKHSGSVVPNVRSHP